MIVIKKNGKYLAYKNIENEYEYSDLSEVVATDQSGWHWCIDYEKAKCFMSRDDADVFLAKNRGEFWNDAEIVRE